MHTVGVLLSRFDISIHSPRMRGDASSGLSRPDLAHFNPLPSHEGRRADWQLLAPIIRISIHSPRMRGDAPTWVYVETVKPFQSTPLA